MRHNVAGRLFGRTANQRKALFRGLVGALIKHERIETTVAKAKETRKLAERLVTLGKRGDLHAKRIALAKLPDRTLITKLFDEIAPRFTDRAGGYLRIVRTRRRVNDRAHLAVLEFVDYEEHVMGVQKPSAKKKKKAAEPKKEEKKAAPKKKEAAEPKKEEKKAAEPKKEEKKAAPKKKKAAEPKKEEKKAAPKKKKAAEPKKEEKKAAPKKKKAAEPKKEEKKAAPKKKKSATASAKKKSSPKKKEE
jgi:large subunit ribosomal protein L17